MKGSRTFTLGIVAELTSEDEAGVGGGDAWMTVRQMPGLLRRVFSYADTDLM